MGINSNSNVHKYIKLAHNVAGVAKRAYDYHSGTTSNKRPRVIKVDTSSGDMNKKVWTKKKTSRKALKKKQKFKKKVDEALQDEFPIQRILY